MNGYALEFDVPDLAGGMWAAAVVLVVVELVRFVQLARYPRSRPVRSLVAGLVVLVLVTLAAAGLIEFIAATYGWACLAVGVLALTWLVRLYRRTTRSISHGRRFALVTLRLLTGMAVLLLLARPVLRWSEIIIERSPLAVVVDTSRSMSVADIIEPRSTGPATSRIDALKTALDANRTAMERLAEAFDVSWYALDSELRPAAGHETSRDGPPADSHVDWYQSLSADGPASALADGLDRAARLIGSAGGKPAGVLVFSDGKDNASGRFGMAEIGGQLAGAGVAVFAVGVGSETPVGQSSGLHIRRLDAPARVSAMNRLPVHVEVGAAGLAGREIRLELLFDDQPVDHKPLRAARPYELLTADCSYAPTTAGLHRIAVRASVSGSPNPPPVTLSQFVQVVDDKIRVLYIDRARYERAAIARALEAAPMLSVSKMDLNQPAESIASMALPKTVDEWLVYHVVLLGDVDRSSLPQSALRAMYQIVREHGRGLAWLGGVRTLGSAQFRNTQLDGLVGVDLGAVGEWPGEVKFELTQAGAAHPICQLPDEGWKKLPPFAGASRLVPTGTAAEVLIRSDQGEPLLVVQDTGKARTAALAFDSTWQWPLAGEEGLKAHRRFWRQLVLWLANQQADLWVATDRPRYNLARLRAGAETITLTAGMSGPESYTASPPVIRGSWTTTAEQHQPITWIRRQENWEAALSVDQPGEYRVQVEAESDGRRIGRSETAFVVELVDLEMAEPIADLDALSQLARDTAAIGGKYVPLEDLAQLLDQLHSTHHVSEVSRVHRIYLADQWPWAWLGAVVALVTCEWILRRRSGLV